MDREYWRRRRSAALAKARGAHLARARFMPFKPLAWVAAEPAFLLRPSAASEGEKLALGEGGPDDERLDSAYYSALEEGALYLAEQALDPATRAEHLKMARVYRDRAADPSRTRR